MGSINGDVLLNMVPQSATEEKSRTNPEDEVEKNMRYFTQQRQPRDTDILHERRKTGIESPTDDKRIVCAFNVCKLSHSPEL